MDKLKKMFCVNKKVTVFLICLMVVAVLFGSFFPLFLSADDKVLVSDYISSFVLNIKDNIDCMYLFKNGFFINVILMLVIWTLGISIIGIPIVVFLFFFKCFIFGFSISSIIFNYSFKGVLFGLIYIFPHEVINICAFIILCNYSLVFSIRMLGLIFKRSDFNIRSSFSWYFKVLLINVFIVIVCVLYESFVNPFILRLIFNLLSL